MKCPICEGDIKVIDSVNGSDNVIYRKRRCDKCKHVFYTAEFEVTPDSQFKREWNDHYRNRKEMRQ